MSDSHKMYLAVSLLVLGTLIVRKFVPGGYTLAVVPGIPITFLVGYHLK